MSPELPIALLAGVVLGASAHRAGLCTVKAVSEVLTTGRGASALVVPQGVALDCGHSGMGDRAWVLTSSWASARFC